MVARIEIAGEHAAQGTDVDALRRAVVEAFAGSWRHPLSCRTSWRSQRRTSPIAATWSTLSHRWFLSTWPHGRTPEMDPVTPNLRRLVDLLQREVAVRELGQFIRKGKKLMRISTTLSVKQPSIALAPQFGAKKPSSLLQAGVLGVSLFLGAGNVSAAESRAITREADTSIVEDAFLRSAGTSDRSLLKQRPRPVKNNKINNFVQAVFPGAMPKAPAAGPPDTMQQVRKSFRLYIQEQFPSDGKADRKARRRAMALFNDPVLIEMIPNPTLRAGLADLTGTGGEPAINHYMSATTPEGLPLIVHVGFGVPEEWVGDKAIARPFLHPVTKQISYIFNPRYEFEEHYEFSNHLAHEALHQNLELPQAATEEIIALAFQSSIYLEQLATHPKMMARAKTELGQRNFSNAVTRIEGGSGARLGLYTTNHMNRQLVPGSVISARTWIEQFPSLADSLDTPGHPLLREFMIKIAKPGTPVPENPNFDRSTLDFIDQHSHNLTPEELVKAGRTLGLKGW